MATEIARRFYARKLDGLRVRSERTSEQPEPITSCHHPDHDSHTGDDTLRPGNRVHVVAIKRNGEWSVTHLQCLTCEPPHGLDSIPEELGRHDGAALADATLARSGQQLVLSEVYALDGRQSLPGFD